MPAKAASILWRSLFRLEDDSPLSLQARLRQQLIAAIVGGQIPADAAVPSSRELAAELGVARNTVVLAYQQLVDDGYLLARQGSGYFVSADIAGRQITPVAASESAIEASPDWDRRFRILPSMQRNIEKAQDWQAYDYPFIYGQFDPELFPTQDWRACCQQALGVMEIRDWAQDLFTRDDPQLIEEIRTKVLPLRGVWAKPEEIIITIGAQQALYLIADLLVSRDTRVGIENPGYPDARNIFGIRTELLEPLPIDGQGLIVGPALAACDYVYATPSHQSPTTVTMPMARRQALLARAASDDFLIIEDDYETEISRGGRANPALKSLDEAGRVIYVGSLSKMVAPGLRLGYVVAAPRLIEELRSLRRLMIRHPTAFVQRAFALFLALGHYDALSRRVMPIHAERAAVLMAALQQNLPEVRVVPVDGGLSVWLEGPAWLDAGKLAADARAARILIEPGEVYFMESSPPRSCFRLGFASIGKERIPEGIARLAALIARQRPV